ncbi:hypothetical protein B0H16DRAFT_416941 [Mycena metata]|uniref:Uncharacterized protein n=1 Tax=Mycena metata TaxID=1033252 RepID=A0AAD7JKN8_9AGAR|nr:hypothetical protein B0H16DRAFT_416941 [Mycena metata]
MFVPFLTKKKQLSRRRGGGKSGGGGGESGGGGGESGGGGEKGSGSTGSGESGSTGAPRSSPVTTSGSSKQATSYGVGGGAVVTIPSGQLFTGRMEGGATRAQVFGTRTFGSGYPGISGRGVANRGFPFYFWPLSFGVGTGTGLYLRSDDEYGHADNSSRPGGAMTSASFQSNSTNSTVFRVLADNTTTESLINDIFANCSGSLASSAAATVPIAYNDNATDPPQPEQIVQYYRASSVALSLDGYNNTAIFQADGTPDIPLPSGIDTTLLDCLNQTIGLATPLIGGAGSQWVAIPNNMSLLFLVLLGWFSAAFM